MKKHGAVVIYAAIVDTFPSLCSWLGIYGHSRFCNTDTEDIVGLHESIRRLNRHYARASMSSAPDEPYKFNGLIASPNHRFFIRPIGRLYHQ